MQLEIAISVATGAVAAGSALAAGRDVLERDVSLSWSGGIHGSSHDRYQGNISCEANVRFGRW